jgi:hypothetical protein
VVESADLEVVDAVASIDADRRGRSIFGRMASAFRTRSFIESHFEEETASPFVRRHLLIDVSALESDRYVLELQVTDLLSGSTIERSQEFLRQAGVR